MLCVHLRDLERAIQARGIRETSRGQAWSKNCREWVYFDCHLERGKIRKRFNLDACVQDHEHRGTHDGSEAGFVCALHDDAIMGVLGPSGAHVPAFPGGQKKSK